jgi:alginate O-acetyltransferase complex protein AlgI
MSSTFDITTPESSILPGKHDRRRALQESHAATNPVRFLALVAQIAGLMLLFRYYHLDSTQFLITAAFVFAAFFVHYWLPFRFKEIFWVAVSITGSVYLVGLQEAAIAVGMAIAIYLILRSPLKFRWRVVILIIFLAGFLYISLTGRFAFAKASSGILLIIFGVRIIAYTYDQAHAKKPASVLSCLSYFLILPLSLSAFFPIIDFQTMRATYYGRNIHDIAQQGIQWMARGSLQLILYRIVLYFYDSSLPDRITTLPKLTATLVLGFLLYIRVSGSIIIVVGMLHLFGYDLPETNRRYLLASGFLDYWRRVNIYFKDFMLKIIYLPVYFKLRKRGDLFAQVAGCAAVFIASWAAHSDSVWISGKFVWTETAFWWLFGLLVIANVVYEARHKVRRAPANWRDRGLLALRTAGTFAAVSILWSIHLYPTISSWLYVMARWTGAGAH